MMNIPIYQAKLNEDDKFEGLQCISLVNNPAVEIPFIKFSEQKQQLNFSIDKSHRTVSGVALRADYPIYRIGPSGEEYYIVFSKEVIEQLVKKYAKDQLQNNVSVNHNGQQINDVHMYETYILNKERGICPTEFADIEDGSWIVSYFIEDDRLWEELQNGNLIGFSVEAVINIDKYQKNEFSMLDKIKDKIQKVLFDENQPEMNSETTNQEVIETINENDGDQQESQEQSNNEQEAKPDEEIKEEVKEEIKEEPKIDYSKLLNEKDDTINNLNNNIIEKEKSINELNNKISSLEKTIEELNEKLKAPAAKPAETEIKETKAKKFTCRF